MPQLGYTLIMFRSMKLHGGDTNSSRNILPMTACIDINPRLMNTYRYV